jgi:hypothetical protein
MKLDRFTVTRTVFVIFSRLFEARYFFLRPMRIVICEILRIFYAGKLSRNQKVALDLPEENLGSLRD